MLTNQCPADQRTDKVTSKCLPLNFFGFMGNNKLFKYILKIYNCYELSTKIVHSFMTMSIIPRYKTDTHTYDNNNIGD